MADVRQELALETIGLVERDVGLSELAELEIEAAIDRAELIGTVLEIRQHRVERLGELLELVAGADVRADVEIAFADALRGLLQHAHGLKDQARGDEVEDDDRQSAREHAGGEDE